jgi:hypothetical protein
MREPSPLLLLLDMVDRPSGLWLCLRRGVVEALEDFEAALDELQETIECRYITYRLVWDFIEAYGDTTEWVKDAVKFLDWCCVQRWYWWRIPPRAMYVQGFVLSFGQLVSLLTPFVDSVTGMLGASQAGTGSRVLPSGTAVLFAELVADFQEGEWIEEIGRKQPHKALWLADSMNPWNRRN